MEGFLPWKRMEGIDEWSTSRPFEGELLPSYSVIEALIISVGAALGSPRTDSLLDWQRVPYSAKDGEVDATNRLCQSHHFEGGQL